MKRKEYSGYLFILPLVILFLIFIVYPIVYNFIISFYNWNGISIEKDFAGFSNYFALFIDPIMIRIIKNFIIFAFSTIIIQAFFGLIFASLFMNKLKLSGFYRIIFYIPVIATPAIVGNIFSKIFETNRGYLNQILRLAGLDSLTGQWLADPKLALGCIIFVNIWQWTGYSMLLYYANMLNIPQDLYEAATIDGANKFQQFTKITFPLLRGTHFTLFIMGMLGSLKCFDLPYVLTKGGPNYATEFLSTYIYKQSFSLFNQGQASALVVIMFLIAMFITMVQLKLYYRNDKDKELAG
ncbi:ABC transporter permease subunit [Anaerocolumna sedimenticola]|uniref:ABC transporter permease subunit n=1 Tax=Anaerocolumna sedimenticola TaxID=2696063 RepID=A0A6P1TLU0_9FIRM|nr:sugar ABC transporter permease [Anaerocolumna sedimenticola]QHQ61102.1 ABC transporter permease subunit [Anaerocolumna sedimenticola]